MTPILNYRVLQSQSKAQSLNTVRLTQKTKLAVHVNPYSWETSGTVWVFLSLFISAQHTPRDPTPLLLHSGSPTFSSAGGLTSPAAIVSMAPSECSLCSKIPVPFTYSAYRQRHAHSHTHTQEIIFYDFMSRLNLMWRKLDLEHENIILLQEKAIDV